MNGLERPTAPQGGRFDLSPSPERASVAPADRFEPCVCGGLIAVCRGERVDWAVMRHNLTATHLSWRWRMGV
jgi:hypothetical protein